jgi:hypothetical protein
MEMAERSNLAALVGDIFVSMPEDLDENDYSEELIDRSTITVFNSFAEADAATRAYWHSRTPVERVRHAEYLRQLNYGARATEPFQRVFEIADRRSR